MAAYSGNNEFEIQVYLVKRSNFLLKIKIIVFLEQ